MVTNPSEVVSEGEVRKVKILRIEAERKRLGLSMRQAEEGFVEEVHVVESPESVNSTSEDPLESTEPVVEADPEDPEQQEQE